ncbi:MAG: hypothetical protein AAFY76_15780, partial [Cyanobacteria bacterium J06649_11]
GNQELSNMLFNGAKSLDQEDLGSEADDAEVIDADPEELEAEETVPIGLKFPDQTELTKDLWGNDPKEDTAVAGKKRFFMRPVVFIPTALFIAGTAAVFIGFHATDSVISNDGNITGRNTTSLPENSVTRQHDTKDDEVQGNNPGFTEDNAPAEPTPGEVSNIAVALNGPNKVFENSVALTPEAAAQRQEDTDWRQYLAETITGGESDISMQDELEAGCKNLELYYNVGTTFLSSETLEEKNISLKTPRTRDDVAAAYAENNRIFLEKYYARDYPGGRFSFNALGRHAGRLGNGMRGRGLQVPEDASLVPTEKHNMFMPAGENQVNVCILDDPLNTNDATNQQFLEYPLAVYMNALDPNNVK